MQPMFRGRGWLCFSVVFSPDVCVSWSKFFVVSRLVFSRLCDLVMVCHIIAMFYAAGVSWVCVVVCFRGVVITFLCILATSVRARDSC